MLWEDAKKIAKVLDETGDTAVARDICRALNREFPRYEWGVTGVTPDGSAIIAPNYSPGWYVDPLHPEVAVRIKVNGG